MSGKGTKKAQIHFSQVFLAALFSRKKFGKTQKHRKSNGFAVLMLELLPGFEPGTSSLPRMRSTD